MATASATTVSATSRLIRSTSRPTDSADRLAPRDALAAILLPSMETTPTLTIPAAEHNARTWANSPVNAS